MNANDVISIITNALSSIFPEAEVYKESIKQDFDTPSFYVSEINNTHSKLPGNAYRKKFNMSIKYFPDGNNTDNVRQELHSVSDQLTEVLEIISYDNKLIKSYNMEGRIEDDILHFMFDIKIKVIKTNEVNKFGPLEVNVNDKQI